jgi:hypothetical protein
MKKLTFYEQVGIIIPGSVLLFGLLFFFPSLKELLAKDGVSVGQLGIFVLLSYAAGHLIAAVGNFGESLTPWTASRQLLQRWSESVQSSLYRSVGRSLAPNGNLNPEATLAAQPANRRRQPWVEVFCSG